MTDKILEMAKEAGLLDQVETSQGIYYDFSNAELEAFANLIRADERNQLRPFNWTEKMSEAWHKAIPDLHKAFDDLMKARGV